MSKSLKEAKKYVKEGDEALKTGLFKWSKDYTSAAVNYDEAAKIYRLAQEYDTATKVYEKLIDVNDKMNDSWAVARNYEAIVTMSIERKDGVIPASEPLVNWTTKAGTYFRMANSHNTYISLVKKVTKFLEEQGQFVDAMNLFKSLLNELEDDEQLYIRAEIVTAYAGLLVKVRKYPECIAIFEREYTLKRNLPVDKQKNLDTLALTIIALYLIMDDIDKAEKKLQDFAIEIPNFFRTPEFDVSEKMVEAYIDGKQDEFNKSAQRSIVNNIFPLNIIKELRNVKVKACPEKRRVINLDDNDGGMNDNFRTSNNQSEFFSNASNKESVQPVVNEEQRKKAIDDFLC